jgi:hypothetical protein
LGKAAAGGHDTIWLSCTGFRANKEDIVAMRLPEGVPQEMTRGTDSLGTDLDFSKDETFDLIAKLNDQNVKDTRDCGEIRVRVGWPFVVIGDGHEGNVENYLKRQQDVSVATIIVKKGKAFKGAFTIKGIPASKHKEVQLALASFKSDVSFE